MKCKKLRETLTWPSPAGSHWTPESKAQDSIVTRVPRSRRGLEKAWCGSPRAWAYMHVGPGCCSWPGVKADSKSQGAQGSREDQGTSRPRPWGEAGNRDFSTFKYVPQQLSRSSPLLDSYLWGGPRSEKLWDGKPKIGVEMCYKRSESALPCIRDGQCEKPTMCPMGKEAERRY